MSPSGRTTSKGGKGTKADKSYKSDAGKGGGDKIHNKEQSSKMEELSIKDKVKQLMELTRRSEDEVCLALHESDNDVNLAINLLFEEISTGEWETKDKKKKKRQASAGKQDKGADEGTTSTDDWDEALPPTGNIAGAGDGKDWKERGGGRKDNKNFGGSNRSYNRSNEGRGWRGRDRDQNEEGGGRGCDRRGGRGQGTIRGGGGRGRGGGRAGGRYPPRGNRGGSGSGRDYNRQPIDTWDNSNTWDNNTAASAATNHSTTNDDWDDFHTDEWSTEEYTGSLVETKVFTPSIQLNMEILETSTQQPGLDQNMPDTVYQDASTYSQPLGQAYNPTVQMPSQQSPVPPMVGSLTAAQTQYFSQLSQQNSDTLNKQYASVAYQPQSGYDAKSDVQQVYSSSTSQVYTPTTLSYSSSQQSYSNTAQPYTTQAYSASSQNYNSSSQSLNTSQPYSNSSQSYNNSSQSFTNPSQSYNNSSQSYSNTQLNYGSPPPNNTFANSGYQTDSYGTTQETQPVQQPTRTKTQRARVPPPSKIPASAVEMPGDLNSSITYLDVQFGAMDLIDNSFDSNAASEVKYGTENNRSTSTLENNTPTTGLDLGTSTSSNQSATLDTFCTTKKGALHSTISSALSQGLSNTESIPQTSDHLTYNTASTRNSAQAGVSSVPSVTTPAALDLKQQTDSHSYNSQTSTYNAYQSKPSTYNSSPYNTAQSSASSYVNPASTNYVNNQASSYGSTTQNSSPYPNSYSTASGQSYQNTASAAAANATYPSVTQSATANSYQSSHNYPSSHIPNQSVYGANTALVNNSNYGGTTPSQFNSYSTSTNNHKLEKENTYGANSSVISGTPSTTSSNVTSSSTSMPSSSSQTTSSSKNTGTLAKSSNSVVTNIPPGVTPVMSTPYIMGQVPYFQQPVYSYEDMQLLQQRLPHMTTPYYDMGYQTPTTLAAVRGDPTGGLGGYSTISADGRFATATARGDGNTSPVPSNTLAAAVQSQASTLTAQQGHQGQPILAAGTGPPYFFATAFNTIAAAPNYAQFGAMYTQLPPATNAHGSSTSSQYGPKPATYGSAGYGAYDALGQTAQDYAKSGYTVGTAAAVAAVAAQQAQKSQSNATTGGSSSNDLSAMYGKSHAALGKVNSYEKQGFHSGTPPPFTGAIHGNQNAGLAPGGAGYAQQVYIPTMPPQHHSTLAMHQPLHQDSVNSSNQRSQGSNQAKAGSKPYGTSYWNQN